LELINKNIWILEIGGVEVWITQTIVNTWIIMAILIVFAVIVRIKLRNFKEEPTAFQNAVEMMVETFDRFVRGSAGEKLSYLGNWYFTVFVFILISNLSGIIGMRPPTADWNMTLAIALSTFALIQFAGVKYRGWSYIKSFFEPNFVFFPLNLVGELARPISLSFRLFGNVLAGMIVMLLIYNVAPVAARFVLPAALHAYFDIASGAIQTYIFCVLSLSFIGGAAEAEG
jgi:F-type H+-transporting ATPase subunit a